MSNWRTGVFVAGTSLPVAQWERWMMRSVKGALLSRSQGLRNTFWLVARPKLMLDWYRMWGTLPVSSWLRAADCFLKKDFSQAALHYRRGLNERSQHPARHCARMDLAYCLYRCGDLEGAHAELSEVTSASVALRDAYLLQSKVEDILGRPEAALRTLSDGIALFPHDLKLFVAKIHIALFNRLGEQARLLEAREQLVRLKRDMLLDDHRQVLVDGALAHFEIRLGDAECGERMLARALATGVAPYEVVLLRGERLLEQRRMLQAREQLGRAMRISPRNPRPAKILAESYLQPGDYSELDYAEQLASLACRLSAWKNSECIELLSRIFDAKGDPSTAELLGERGRGLRADRLVEQQLSENLPAPVAKDARRGLKLEM